MGTSWTAVSTVLGVVVGIVSRPVLVAFVGVDGYGVWASAIAVASMFSLGGDLGVASALPKVISQRKAHEDEEGTFTLSSVLFGLSTGGIAASALILSSPIIGNRIPFSDFSLLLMIQAIQMPLSFAISSLLAFLQGSRLFRTYSVSTILLAGTNLLLMILFLTLGAGLVGVMVASLLSTTIVFACLLIFLRPRLRVPRLRQVRADLAQLVPFGLQVTVSILLSRIMYQIDILIVSLWTLDPNVIGSYSLAVFVARLLWILPGSVSLTTYPVVSQYSTVRDSRRLSKYLGIALTGSCAITGVLAAAIVLFGKSSLQIAFGQDALPAYGLTLLLLAGTAALGSVRSVAPAILGVGRTRVAIWISAVGAVLTTGSCIILTLIAGVAGTAIAVSISFLCVSGALVWATAKYVLPKDGQVPFYRRLGAIAFGALALSAAAMLFAALDSVLWASLIGTGIWVVGSLALLFASGGRTILRAVVGSPK